MKKASPLDLCVSNVACMEGEGEFLRHDTALKHTEKRSGDQQSPEVLYESTAQRYKAETAYQERQVVLRANLLQDDVAGYLDEHVDDVKDGGDPIESVPYVETKVFLHSLDTRISHVHSAVLVSVHSSH
jgi:hypothetical protein